MTLLEVLRARKRIAPHVRRTPLMQSQWLSDVSRATVRLKLESLQISCSFKWRGALNAVLARLERHEATGRLVTASAGNHGRALAAAAEMFHLPLTVFTPADAPQAKLAAIRRHGAELRAEGDDYDDAERRAKRYAEESGMPFISPYSDIDVIAGAATIAVEVLEDRPDTNVFLVPVGGGGLISGIAAAAKAVDAGIAVIGVEVDASCPFQTSLSAGRLVTIVPQPTLADGLAGNPDPETITFDMIQRTVARVVTVSEQALASALAGLVETEHVVAEGAGAVAVAALVSRRVDAGRVAGGTAFELEGREVAAIVSGANIDRRRLAPLIA